jgi:diacylglycerol kinase family enzyme
MPDFIIVLNVRSGSRDARATQTTIRETLERAGRAYELLEVPDARFLADAAQRAAATAARTGAAVVAAGGDGTLNAVAQAVLAAGARFGVIPLGTFNLFARNHAIPLDTADAAGALVDAEVRDVQVGVLNDRPFLVNASLGLYPKLLADREAFKQRHGRSRVSAFGSGLLTLLRERGQLALRLDQDDKARVLRTPTLVVGNNRLQLERIGVDAAALEAGRLVAIAVKPVGTLALIGLAMQGALGRLGEAEDVVSFAFRHLVVRPGNLSARYRIKVAIDGEVVWTRTPLVFAPGPTPLRVLVPRST